MRRILVVATGLLSLVIAVRAADGQEIARLEQQAFNAAVESVANCVVQIQTVGGLDQVGDRVLAQGPTTGLIVRRDGYIVSSAFNFAQQPASVLVRLPNGQERPADIIGHDTNRMLVLLKVDASDPLPTPEAAPLADIAVGQWAVAVGRTYSAERVNLSVGVISALGRMYGRVIQADASASAANYGGPLVDLHGRVLGVLVPMAPQPPGETDANELAGAEYYDSGIAFAVPLAHIQAILDRWIEAKDLKRGLLGVGMAEGSPYGTPPKITAVWPGSPAADAGWKPDDVIVAVDGKQVETQTQLRFQLAPRYAGDALQVTIRRGEGDEAKELETKVTLADKLAPYRQAFLGVLPERPGASRDVPVPGADAKNDADASAPNGDSHAPDATPASGVTIRTVWPGSPAAKAGLEGGDCITKLGAKDVASLDDAFTEMTAHNPGDELEVVAVRDGVEVKVTATLSELPTDVLANSDFTRSGSDDDAEKPPSADAAPMLEELKLPDLPQIAHYYRPPDEGSPPGVLIWLAAGDDKTNAAVAGAWRAACERDRLVLLLPTPSDAKGWSSDDMEFLGRLLPAAMMRFGADPHRIVVGGEGKAGQLAYALGFKGRKFVRGVAVCDSPLPRTLELPQTRPGAGLAVLSIETQNAPLTMLIHQDLKKLADAGYPASQVIRRSTSAGDGQLDATMRATVARWIDGLDRF